MSPTKKTRAAVLIVIFFIAVAIGWMTGLGPLGILLIPLGLATLAAEKADTTDPIFASYLLFLFVLSSLFWAQKSRFAISCIVLPVISLLSVAGWIQILNNWGY